LKLTPRLAVVSFPSPNVIRHALLSLLVGFVWLSASNQHISAQEGEQKALAVDLASADNEPDPTMEGLRLEEVKLRVRRARIGLLSTTGVFVVGTALYAGSAARTWSGTGPDPLRVAGASLFVSAAVGMLTTGIILGVRNRQLNQLQPRDEGINRARIALLSATGVFVASGVLWIAYASSCPLLSDDSGGCAALGAAATVMLVGGAATMIATGVWLGVRRRKFSASQQVPHVARRRVRWDVAHARVVF